MRIMNLERGQHWLGLPSHWGPGANCSCCSPPFPSSSAALESSTTLGSKMTSDKKQEVFKDELGQCHGVQAHLHVMADATPKFYKCRPIPLSMNEKEEANVERKGVLQRIETSEWAAPIVPGPKSNNSVRVWGLQSNDKPPLGCKPVPSTTVRGTVCSTKWRCTRCAL